MALKKYIAYHVDMDGTARASCELQAIDDASAIAEAGHLSKQHPTVEVWQGTRFVARVMNPEPGKP